MVYAVEKCFYAPNLGGTSKVSTMGISGDILRVFVIFISIASGPVIAADISLFKDKMLLGERQHVVHIAGDMNAEDILTFKQIIKSLPPQTIISLDSPGGNLQAGIEIGKVIATSGFATYVSGICASSCALAWLAGAPRILSPSAKVGFHLAYKNDLDKTESGAGNALVGSYVTELGLGENVVRYITSAAPTDIQWLTSRDADLLGVDVILSNIDTKMGSNKNTPENVVVQETTDAAIELIKSIIISTTYSDIKALKTVREYYADNILYFGKLKSKSEVYSDKRKYLTRWPYRTVSLREDTITASCRFSRCKVTGIYNWGVGNAKGSKKSGTASFIYEFEVSDTIHIIAEGGEVLSRH